MNTQHSLHFKCLTCEALARPVYLAAAHSPHIIDVELFRLGLHNDPEDLRARLQARIQAAAEEEAYDYIVMAYGLCGRATDGLTAYGVPLVLPRAHDCITLFLGSRHRYQREFTEHPGTYWYVRDYVERAQGGTALSLGSEMSGDTESKYEEYVEKYGRDNADYLMEVMGAWREHYDRAAYIELGVVDSADVKARTREEAARRGWRFDHLTGDLVLVRRLLEGVWLHPAAAGADDFLILQPGERVKMSYDTNVIGADVSSVAPGG